MQHLFFFKTFMYHAKFLWNLMQKNGQNIKNYFPYSINRLLHLSTMICDLSKSQTYDQAFDHTITTECNY